MRPPPTRAPRSPSRPSAPARWSRRAGDADKTAPAAPAPGRRPPRRPAARVRAQRELVVAVDAGHGGQDVGAIGPSGTYEKDIVLAVARELVRLINRQPGMRAV
ncbi:MAG: N-acetylmuramoyl-L-alanine amidase, partial [Proteobacteria bacterium]|nr:N-acetylmuramoyl-L-alanine amidase [Pseudomonadota bacterium]